MSGACVNVNGMKRLGSEGLACLAGLGGRAGELWIRWARCVEIWPCVFYFVVDRHATH